MSKASEFAAKVKAAAAIPEPFQCGSPITARFGVTHNGGMSTHVATLSADEALALARWILDTFGEPDAR